MNTFTTYKPTYGDDCTVFFDVVHRDNQELVVILQRLCRRFMDAHEKDIESETLKQVVYALPRWTAQQTQSVSAEKIVTAQAFKDEFFKDHLLQLIKDAERACQVNIKTEVPLVTTATLDEKAEPVRKLVSQHEVLTQKKQDLIDEANKQKQEVQDTLKTELQQEQERHRARVQEITTAANAKSQELDTELQEQLDHMAVKDTQIQRARNYCAMIESCDLPTDVKVALQQCIQRKKAKWS